MAHVTAKDFWNAVKYEQPLDPAVYGQYVKAWRYRDDERGVLVHWKPLTKGASGWNACGVWVVLWEGEVVKRKAYFNVGRTPPFGWAREQLVSRGLVPSPRRKKAAPKAGPTPGPGRSGRKRKEGN